MIAYVDSSVLLRRILGQPGSVGEWDSIETPVASAVVEMECRRTLGRLRLRRVASDHELAVRREIVFAALQRFEIVEVGRSLLSRAARHGQDLVMATAARASGFMVIGSS